MDYKVKVFSADVDETHISGTNGASQCGCASTAEVRVFNVDGYLVSCLDGVGDGNLIETLSELDRCRHQDVIQRCHLTWMLTDV